MRQLHRDGREDGSVILALLAALVIGGIVVTLMATTAMGQRQVRFDRSFGNAIHAADSGVHAALTQVNAAEVDPDAAPPIGHEISLDEASAVSGAGDVDTKFWYTATKDSKTRWEVESWGRARDGTLRHVEATIEIPPIFQYAAFAKVNVGTAGDNCADSYDSNTDDDDSTVGPQASDTGRGVIGTNGEINVSSSTASCIDGIELHDFFDDPDDPNDDDQDDIAERVSICNSAECQKFHVLQDDDPTGKVFGLFPKPLVVDDWWITRSLSTGQDERPDSLSNPSWRERCNGDGSVPNSLTFDRDNPPVRGTVYCAGTGGVAFERVQSTGEEITLEDNPSASFPGVVVYTSGPVKVDGQIYVNCEDCDTPDPSANNLPIASDLQIYSTGSQVTIRQQTHIGALIYTPRAKCGGGADVHIWGAIVCQEMANQGSWNFHFDQASRQVSAAEYHITHWHEEVLDS